MGHVLTEQSTSRWRSTPEKVFAHKEEGDSDQREIGVVSITTSRYEYIPRRKMTRSMPRLGGSLLALSQ